MSKLQTALLSVALRLTGNSTFGNRLHIKGAELRLLKTPHPETYPHVDGEGEWGASWLQWEGPEKQEPSWGQGSRVCEPWRLWWGSGFPSEWNGESVYNFEERSYILQIAFTKNTLKQTMLQINYNSLFKNGLRKIKSTLTSFLRLAREVGRRKTWKGVSSLPPSFREEIAVAGGGSAE